MGERMITFDGIELCAETFGGRSAPPILLIMGMGASMIWWHDDFCRMLAAGGTFVIRYDHRDTGRSTSYEPGHPGYGAADLVSDAIAVLDAFEISVAHVVGLSMGGALAQLLALRFPERVASLVLISTSLAVPDSRGTLPPPARSYTDFLASAAVNWSDAESVVGHLVDHWRALAGDERPFDQAYTRELAARDVRRARNFASAQNHGLLADDAPAQRPLTEITAPTLVIHGSVDPLFPLDHGRSLAEAIPGATLLPLDGAGHGIQRPDWDAVVEAIVRHTAR
jgi:pimeloyl-ACP methyl ester carboxylesterase